MIKSLPSTDEFDLQILPVISRKTVPDNVNLGGEGPVGWRPSQHQARANGIAANLTGCLPHQIGWSGGVENTVVLATMSAHVNDSGRATTTNSPTLISLKDGRHLRQFPCAICPITCKHCCREASWWGGGSGATS